MSLSPAATVHHPVRNDTSVDTRRDRLSSYDLVAKLGQGGMAEVYLAIARGPISDFHKLVVLKRLHSALESDQGIVDMFLAEAKLAARLSHPNIVTTFSVDADEGCPFIVMEYLEGVSLGALIESLRGRPSSERWPLLSAISQALAGLHYVHEFKDYDGTPLRLVHRDIKPSNVFVTFDGQVKLLDFGIAKAMGEGSDSTASMALKGTARYMAPESVCDARSVDRRSDIFAMGVVLWEAATGTIPWNGLDNMRILLRLADRKTPLTEAVEILPPDLHRICARSMSADRLARVATAQELKLELDVFLRRNGDGSGGPEALASLVQRTFGEIRERRAAAIRARLDDLAASGPLPRLPGFGQSEPSAPRPNASASQSHRSLRAAGRPIGLFIAGGMLASAMVWTGYWLGSRPAHDGAPTPPLAPASTANLRPPVPAPPEPPPLASTQPLALVLPPVPKANVEIDVQAIPSSASLYFDGGLLERNPAHVSYPREGSTHRLEARAPGYEAATLDVIVDRDRVISLTLQPLPPPKRRQTAATNASEGMVSTPDANRSAAVPTPPPPRFGELPKPGELATSLRLDETIPWSTP